MKCRSSLRIGLPRKRYLPFAEAVLTGMKAASPSGRLFLQTAEGHSVFLLRAPDIPGLVMSADLDIGLSPDEWTIEHQLARSEGPTLNRVPAMSLGVNVSLLEHSGRSLNGAFAVVASSYPAIADTFLRSNGISARVISVSGSVEALVPAIADAAIDCVETGRTARIHGLVETRCLYENLGLSLVFVDSKLEACANEIAVLVRNSEVVAA